MAALYTYMSPPTVSILSTRSTDKYRAIGGCVKADAGINQAACMLMSQKQRQKAGGKEYKVPLS
jgi:hypothetical protein